MRYFRMIFGSLFLTCILIIALTSASWSAASDDKDSDLEKLIGKFKNLGLALDEDIFSSQDYVFSYDIDPPGDDKKQELNVDDLILRDRENKWFFRIHDFHIFVTDDVPLWAIDAITMVIHYDDETILYESSLQRKEKSVKTQKSTFHWTGNGASPISEDEVHKALLIVLKQSLDHIITVDKKN